MAQHNSTCTAQKQKEPCSCARPPHPAAPPRPAGARAGLLHGRDLRGGAAGRQRGLHRRGRAVSSSASLSSSTSVDSSTSLSSSTSSDYLASTSIEGARPPLRGAGAGCAATVSPAPASCAPQQGRHAGGHSRLSFTSSLLRSSREPKASPSAPFPAPLCRPLFQRDKLVGHLNSNQMQ